MNELNWGKEGGAEDNLEGGGAVVVSGEVWVVLEVVVYM
jgi:hypothetical protein